MRLDASGGIVVAVPLDEAPVDPDVLDPAEHARLRRMRSERRSREFAAGRTALRTVLAAVLGVEPSAVPIVSGPHGKPMLREPATVHFNLTHSGELGLLAVGTAGALGVDVERVRAGRPFLRLAERFFTPAESRWLRSRGGAARRDAFYRMWTLKEAYLKALGTGLSVSSRAFELDADEPPRLLSGVSGHAPAERWALQFLPVPGDYRAALCTPAGDVEYRLVSLSEFSAGGSR